MRHFVSLRPETGHSNLCALALAGFTYRRYTVLMISHNTDETAVSWHCCDPALLVLVMFGVSKRLSRSIGLAVYSLYILFFFWLIRSLVDPTLAVFIVCSPLQFLVCLISTTILNTFDT